MHPLGTIATAAALTAALLTSPGIVSAQTAAPAGSPCDQAYTAKRWNDVVNACASAADSAGHQVSTPAGSDLSQGDRMALYASLITSTLHLASAYSELGDSRMADVNLQKAGLWLELAQSQGLSSDSAEYKALQSEIKRTQAALGPQP